MSRQIQGYVKRLNNVVVEGAVVVATPLHAAFIFEASAYVGKQTTATSNALGLFTMSLISGDYDLVIDGRTAIRIRVPADGHNAPDNSEEPFDISKLTF